MQNYYGYILFEKDDYNMLLDSEIDFLNGLTDIAHNKYHHYCKEFGVKNPLPLQVGYLLPIPGKKVAGMQVSSKEMNRNFIYISYTHSLQFPDRMVDDTILHETAHAFCDVFSLEEHTLDKHGKLWKDVVTMMGGYNSEYFGLFPDEVRIQEQYIKKISVPFARDLVSK